MKVLGRIGALVVVIAVLGALVWGLLCYQKNDQENYQEKGGESQENFTINQTSSIGYSSDELIGEYTNYTAKIDLNEMSITEGGGVLITGTTINISRAGTYYFTGTAEEGNIVVNADNQEVVLVLDTVTMTSSKTSVIEVEDAKKVTINLPEGTTSIITDGTNYEGQEEDEPNATIFSKDDLTIDGKGILIIHANYEDAIGGKDGVKIVGTTLTIDSVDDGIRGKDYVAIKEATITIKAKAKGIKATEDEDTSKGVLMIDSGTITIESEDDALHANNSITIQDGTLVLRAEDDGIHADNSLVINGGKISIEKSYEGMEATYLEINGGEIDITASDDGINICGGNDSFGMFRQDSFGSLSQEDENRKLVINGGTINVEANGDGLDSNGSIEMNGGTVMVGGSTNGGNGALDYNQSFIITGGTLVAYGPTGMWQNPSTNSTQYTIAFQTTGKTGDVIALKDSTGQEIVRWTAKRTYGMVCISTPTLQKGENYTLWINDTEVATQEITAIVTSNGTSEGFGGGKNNWSEQMPSGDFSREDFPFKDMPTPPEGANDFPFSSEQFEQERPSMKRGERPSKI